MKDLTETLNGVASECILEVGCGKGSFIKELSRAQPSAKILVGADVVDPTTTVDPSLLSQEKFKWVHALGSQLPFEDDSFDLVAIAHALHHIEPSDVEPTLAEMKRVLCPGGTFLIYEMYHDGQTEAQQSHVFYHHWLAEVDRLCGIHHYPTFSRDELLGLVERLGLVDCQIEDFNEVYDAETESVKMSEMLDKMERRVEDVQSSPEYDRLKQEVQSINIWMMTHGMASPTRLIVRGRVE